MRLPGSRRRMYSLVLSSLFVGVLGPALVPHVAVPGEVADLVLSDASGEWWPADGRRGRRRIVVSAHGDEHLYSIVRAEWRVVESDGSESTRAALDVGGLSDEPLTIVRSVRYVGTRPPGVGVFEATVAHRYEEKTQTVQIRLGAPGEISLERPE